MNDHLASVADQVLEFTVADGVFAVPAAQVREVTRNPILTRVPQGPSALAGLMNFHGTAIPVVRLSSILGAKAGSTDADQVVVYGDGPVGLLVNRVIKLDGQGSGSRRLDIPELLAANFPVRTVAKATVGREMSSRGAASAEEVVSVLAFRIADQRFAMPLEAIVEALVLPQNLAVVPRSVKAAVGMLDWRGAVLPLLSLAELMNLRPEAGRSNVLVTRLGKANVGLVCGAIDAVLRVPVSSVEAVPAILQRGQGDAEIDAVARLGDGKSIISILSPKKLLQSPDIEQVLERSPTGAEEVSQVANTAATIQLVIFQLGEEAFGLPLSSVSEIVQLPEALTRVPKAPPFIAGVMNLRGRALPVIDLRQRFQAKAERLDGKPRVVVVSTPDLQAGFIVDGVSEILRVSEAAVTSAPELPGETTRMFDRVTVDAADGAMILIIDPQELLDRAERDMLAQFGASERHKALP